MGKRELEVVLVSAQFLRRYTHFPLIVSARAYISSDPGSVKYTRADHFGDVNPRWNQALRFTLSYHSTFSAPQDCLIIELYNKMPNGISQQEIARFQIPLKDWTAFAGDAATRGRIPISCQLNTGGVLYISYRLGAYASTASAVFNHPFGKICVSFLTSATGGLISSHINQHDDHENFDNDNHDTYMDDSCSNMDYAYM
jgi:hypothetical protein